MIHQSKVNESSSPKRSAVAALFFAMVMIMGMFWIFNDPPGTKYDKPVTVSTSQDEEPKPIQTNYGWYFFRMVAVIGFLIALFVVGVKYYKRKMTQTGHYFDMRVLGKQYFSAKQYLLMVRVEDRKMLLGITDQSINLLKEFDKHEDYSESDENANELEKGFGKILKRIKTDE